jgi:hypothetical protein
MAASRGCYSAAAKGLSEGRAKAAWMVGQLVGGKASMMAFLRADVRVSAEVATLVDKMVCHLAAW